MEKYILASASPRRKELLEQIGIKFDIVVSNADESKVGKDMPVMLYVEELAMLKAAATADYLRKNKRGDFIIISADTVVTLDGKILGKPKNEEGAFSMLCALSGKKHEVFTGICVMRSKDGFSVADYEKTTVYFNELTDEKIRSYIKTGEPMDKAGAYGIQGRGAVLVNRIDGDYFNVVGLPLSKLSKILESEFND